MAENHSNGEQVWMSDEPVVDKYAKLDAARDPIIVQSYASAMSSVLFTSDGPDAAEFEME